MQDNFIKIYEGIFSEDFCNKTIKYYEDMKDAGFGFTRQQVDKVSSLQKDDVSIFSNSEDVICLATTKDLFVEFNSVFWNVAYPDYSSSFSILENHDKHNIYSAKIQKTLIGGGYHVWHCESASRANCNRILAWTLYLNDVEEGGETEYLYQHLRIKPKKGTLVIWPAGFTHVHRGNTPISNEKYIVTGWVEF